MKAIRTRRPLFNVANIQGNLVNTGASTQFYGFQPTDAPAFVALPNYVSGMFSAIVTGYPQTFPFGNTNPTNWTVPNNFTQQAVSPPSTASGLFLKVLSPTDFSVIYQQFFATGESQAALNNLVTNLPAVNGTIVIITSQGNNPFGGVTLGGPTTYLAQFCGIVANMGVSEHACAQAGTGGNGMFSMVGVYQAPTGGPATVPSYSKTYSSTYEVGQNDSGSLQGLFKRNHQFRLVPYQVSSFDTSTISSSSTWDSILSFALPTQVGSAPVTTWPLLDTPGHQAAYAYLSNVIVGKVLFANGTCTVDAAYCDDVRAWYSGSQVQTFAGLDLSASPVYAFPSSASGFTQSDFNDVKSQVQAEFVYLNNELNYETWFDNVTNGALLNTGSALSAAANEISSSLISQYGSIPPKPVSLGSILNFAGDVAGLLPVPGAKQVAGVLHLASGTISLSADGSGTDPTVVQVADLITSTDGQASFSAATYNLALQNQVDNYFSRVRSDWFKLQTFGILTSQPSSNGWYVQDTNGAVSSNLAALTTANARVSFYSQLLPQYFDMIWMDSFPVQAIVNTNTITSSALNNYAVTYYLGTFNNGNTVIGAPNAWGLLSSAVNSTCGDYGAVISQYSYQHYDPNNNSTLDSWGGTLGTVLMGPPSSPNGLGNLNLSQNAFYDSSLPVILSPEFQTAVYSPSMFASLPWGQNISCPVSASVSASASSVAIPTAKLRTLLTAPPNATLTIQPSGSRVGPEGSITVVVSVQPGDPTVTSSPTGIVDIASGSDILALKRLTNGTSSAATATLKINGASLSPGTYSLTVGYGGDSNFMGSTATMNLQVLVAATSTTTSLNLPAVAYQGQNLNIPDNGYVDRRNSTRNGELYGRVNQSGLCLSGFNRERKHFAQQPGCREPFHYGGLFSHG